MEAVTRTGVASGLVRPSPSPLAASEFADVQFFRRSCVEGTLAGRQLGKRLILV